jgi:hypothetical protein
MEELKAKLGCMIIFLIICAIVYSCWQWSGGELPSGVKLPPIEMLPSPVPREVSPTIIGFSGVVTAYRLNLRGGQELIS